MRLRLLLLPLVIALAPAVAEAQILRVHFTDEKAAKKYKKYTCEIGGEMVLLGEPVPGGGVVMDGNNVKYTKATDPRQSDENRFFVLDSEDPSQVPYRYEDGEKVPAGKKSVAIVMGTHVERIAMHARTEDIQSLAREYAYRQLRLQELQDARDAADEGGSEWSRQHMLLVVEYERLVSWLRQLSFHDVADKLERSLEKELKVSKKAALDERAARAQASPHEVDTPASLASAAEAITGGAVAFRVQESEHLRIVYFADLGDERVTSLLRFGEELIEAFRVEFVDPYVGEDFPDRIPDKIFNEFFFGIDDVGHHERYYEDYYGQSWGHNKEWRLESRGTGLYRALDGAQVWLWRCDEAFDYPATVSHNLGHSLAGVHFNGAVTNMNLPWLEEGLAYYLSFEHMGRNSVNCKQFRESEYVRQAGAGETRAAGGLRDMFHATALDQGLPLDKLSLRYLAEFENPDLAKGWSLFDFVAKDMGKDGQLWLRAACAAARDRGKFIPAWRKASEEIFGVEGQDVFQVIDDRWRAYAQANREALASATDD